MFLSNVKDFPPLVGWNFTPDLKANDPLGKFPGSFMVGLEIEFEGSRPDFKDFPTRVWTIHADHSLRPHEKSGEFVSVVLSPLQVVPALKALKRSVGKYPVEFSWRTSTHVHVNVRDLTPSEIAKAILLWVVFEESLNRWAYQATSDRGGSIFCVPINESPIALTEFLNAWPQFRENKFELGYLVLQNLGWEKYGSLGLFRLWDYGSIEFRSLGGILDIDVIREWVGLLLCLRRACVELSFEDIEKTIREINTISNYFQFAQRIFGNRAYLLDSPNLWKDLSGCISRVKEGLFSFPLKDLKKESRITGASLRLKHLRHLSQTQEPNPSIEQLFDKGVW